MVTEPYVDFPCADADSHLMELPGWLDSYVTGPALDEVQDLDLTCAGATTPDDIERTLGRLADRSAGAPPLQDLLTTKSWAAYGGSIPHERSRALDRLGFERQLVITTLATTQFSRSTPDISYEFVRAHNEAVTDFCSADPRLGAVGFVPLEDPERAAAAALDAVDMGCVAVLLPFSPPPHAPTHPCYDGFWDALSTAGVPVVFHLGHGTQTVPRAFHDNGVPTTDFLGTDRSMRAKDAVQAHHSVEVFLTCLVLDGLFDRFPGLRVVCLEFGAGWVPDWMRRLDLARTYADTEPLVAGLARRPSEYVRDHLLVCPQPDEDLGSLLRTCPPEILAFSSDFPHPEGSDDPVGRFVESMGDVAEPTKAAFFRENFRRFFESDARSRQRWDRRAA